VDTIVPDRAVQSTTVNNAHDWFAQHRFWHAACFTCTGSEITGLTYRDKSPYLHYHVIAKKRCQNFLTIDENL
jgi:hypothetical protein